MYVLSPCIQLYVVVMRVPVYSRARALFTYGAVYDTAVILLWYQQYMYRVFWRCMGKCMGNRYHLHNDTSAARAGRATRPTRSEAHLAAPIPTRVRARAR